MKDKEGRLLAVMANPLLRRKLTLGIVEQHVLHMAIAQIPDPRDETAELPVFEVTVEAYAHYTQRSERTGSLYDQLKEAVTTLQNTKVYLSHGEGVAVLAPWARYLKGEAKIQFRIEQSLKPYVLGLRKHFAKIPVAESCRLRSGYAVAFYLCCWSWHRSPRGGWEMSIQDLRDWLDIKPETLKPLGDLKKRVIEQARRELDKKASLSFRAQTLREGRHTSGWFFEVKENQARLAKQRRLEALKPKEEKPQPEPTTEEKAAQLARLRELRARLKAGAVVETPQVAQARPGQTRAARRQAGNPTGGGAVTVAPGAPEEPDPCNLATLRDLAVLEPAAEGGFTATLPDFPEVISEGDDQEQALANLLDALKTYLEWKPPPPGSATQTPFGTYP